MIMAGLMSYSSNKHMTDISISIIIIIIIIIIDQRPPDHHDRSDVSESVSSAAQQHHCIGSELINIDER